MRPMFPHAIDSTILSAFRSCPQKAYLQYIEHWKSKTPSVHLVAGGAFASGVEAARRCFFEDGGSQEDACAIGLFALIEHYGDFECPPESAKSLERTCGALEFYFENYPLGEDGMVPITLPNGKRGIEFSFAEPLPISHPLTGDPILYTGRTDAIVDFAGAIYGVDEKTTTSLGASWPRQWEMRGQFTGYSWAAQQIGIKLQGTIIRGISILKTKYGTLQPITYRTDWEVDRWYKQTIRDVERMIKCWEEGYWDWDMNTACAEYAGCSFMQICKSEEPENWLDMYFEKKVWDPLLKKEVSVEEYEASWGHVREE